MRLRRERANHLWAYDFVEDRTRDGRTFKMLNVVDELTRERLCNPGALLRERHCKIEELPRLASQFSYSLPLPVRNGSCTHYLITGQNLPNFIATAVDLTEP